MGEVSALQAPPSAVPAATSPSQVDGEELGCFPLFVILNLFQDNEQPSHVILKQVQDDERGCRDDGGVRTKGLEILCVLCASA